MLPLDLCLGHRAAPGSQQKTRSLKAGSDENPSVESLRAFVLLSRPHFLVGGAVLYAVGAFSGEVTDLSDYLLGQGMVTSVQVTAHYVNEYADVDADRLVANRTMFSGGSGILSSERMEPVIALRAAWVSSGIASLFAGLVANASPAASVLGLLALALSWAYSMPPVRLLDTGWGELVTSVVVAALVPSVGALVNDETIGSQLIWATAVLVPVHLAMMLAFELPDIDSDRAAGKTVLAVRIGRRAATTLFSVFLAAATLVGLIGTLLDAFDRAWWLPPAALPATVAVTAGLRGRYHLLTWGAVVILMAVAVGLIIGFQA